MNQHVTERQRIHEKLKMVLTPIWDRGMGARLRVAREKQLRTQAELAALLTTPGRPVSQQQVAAAEHGRLEHLNTTWARLEAVLGIHMAYVLVARDAIHYDENFISLRYQEFRLKTNRKNANSAIKGRFAKLTRISR